MNYLQKNAGGILSCFLQAKAHLRRFRELFANKTKRFLWVIFPRYSKGFLLSISSFFRRGPPLLFFCRGGRCGKTGRDGLLEVGRRVEGEPPYYFLRRRALRKNAEESVLGGRAPCRRGGSLTISCRGGRLVGGRAAGRTRSGLHIEI